MTPDEVLHNALADIELSEFDLTTRTRNCLINEEIHKIGQLTSFTAEEILRWRNVGQRTLGELRELLGSLGLKLNLDHVPFGVLDPKLVEKLTTPKNVSAVTKAQPKVILFNDVEPLLQRRLVTRLKYFSLSARAKNVIIQQRLIYLADLVALKPHDLLGFNNSGKQTTLELAQLVESQGFELGTSIDGWSHELALNIEVKYRNEIQQDEIERSAALLSSLGPEPRCLEEELARIAAALETDRNLEMLMELWGWKGTQPRTLDSIGQDLNPKITRERVRQIQARALRKMREFKFDTPYLRAALIFLRKEVPSRAASLSARLREQGLTRTDFSIRSVKAAAKILGLKFPFTEISIGDDRFFVSAEEERRLATLIQIIRRRTSEMGCMNIRSLMSELHVNEGKLETIREVIDTIPAVRWLDQEKTWLFLSGSTRNRLFNLCAKVLGVSPQIRLSELRRAVAKSRRLPMAPPQNILGVFVENTGLGKIEGSIISASPDSATAPDSGSVEGKMLSVLAEFGPIMDGEEFAEKCVAAGINATSFYIYRLVSPVFAALGNGVYCIVGSEVPPGTIEEIISRRRLISRPSDYGWLPSGNLWFGFVLTRYLITTGSLRLPPFVSDLVQGEWQVKLPDGNDYGSVICRESFIWSFRKELPVLGAEPGDHATLEFDRKARKVTIRTGGPGLFEAIQEDDAPDIEDEVSNVDGIRQLKHAE